MHKSSIRNLAFAGIACLMFAATPAQAGFVDNGTTTIDTNTGLEWLDVVESANWSYNDILGEFGVGGQFEGWRHATLFEASTLWSSTPFPIGHAASPADAGILTYIHLFGETLENIVLPFFDMHTVIGYLDAGGSPTAPGLIAEYLVTTSGDDSAVVTAAELPRDRADEIYGHWLVRTPTTVTPCPDQHICTPDPDPEPIPEPSGIALLLTGLAGLGFARRRRIKSGEA